MDELDGLPRWKTSITHGALYLGAMVTAYTISRLVSTVIGAFARVEDPFDVFGGDDDE
jgi:hypothetical protein